MAAALNRKPCKMLLKLYELESKLLIGGHRGPITWLIKGDTQSLDDTSYEAIAAALVAKLKALIGFHHRWPSTRALYFHLEVWLFHRPRAQRHGSG